MSDPLVPMSPRYSTSMTEFRRAKELDRIVHPIELRTRVAAYEVDANAAFTGHAMQRAVDVDQMRRSLAREDPTLNVILAQLEHNFMRSVARTQNDLFSGFGF